MILKKTSLKDAFIIELEKKEDDRGFFARSWDSLEFAKFGLSSKIVQCNISFSKQRGTIRGMHYQLFPYAEAKLIRCTKGKIFDVIIDIRKKSETYLRWESFELSSEKHNMLYVPEGFAHGFQSLVDNTEIFYQVSQFYHPTHEQGIRWNDPTFNISWPIKEKITSLKDESWENFKTGIDMVSSSLN